MGVCGLQEFLALPKTGRQFVVGVPEKKTVEDRALCIHA